MAIVEMKRVTLLAMNAERDRLLRVMQRAGCVQVEAVGGEDAEAYLRREHGALDAAEEKLTRIRWTLSQLGRYDADKPGMLASLSMPAVDAEQADAVAASEEELLAVVSAVEACERKSGELRGRQARLQVQMQQLAPWRGLDIPVERLCDTRDTVQFAGTVLGRAWEALETALAGLPAQWERIAEERDNVCVWVVAHRSARDEVQSALKNAEFAPAQFAYPAGTPAAQLDALAAGLREVDADRASLEEALRGYAKSLPQLRILFELASQERDRQAAAANFLSTRSAFMMQGWAPAPSCDTLVKRLKAVAPDCVVDLRDPDESEQPPTLLHNGRVATPFETVVSNYSMPDPRGIDPTAIMAPFFACFFGMMVSDAGYGAVMAAMIPIAIWKFKPKESMRRMMWILTLGGAFTVFWGAIYDTWFGANLKPAFLQPVIINALEDPLKMMYLCIAMGAIHLFTGLGVGMYMNFKRGKPLAALFDQGFWFFLIIGLGLLMLPATATIGKFLAIGGALGILLTAGRDKPTLIGKFTGGFGALYGITSWLGDLLSYMRLFGMGLATGVIGMVVNMLAGMLMGNPIGIVFGIAVLAVGHIFNAFINVLGAYVHSCRLQYIEFFGKFYEDGGTMFAPLAHNPRYVAIRDSRADT